MTRDHGEPLLLLLRTARQAERELDRVRWKVMSAETVLGGTFLCRATTVSGALVQLSVEPGTVLPEGRHTVEWSCRKRSGEATVIVSPARPAGVEGGPVDLSVEGGQWWARLQSGTDLLTTLQSLSSMVNSAVLSLTESAAEIAERAWPAQMAPQARAAGIKVARRLAQEYSGPQRPLIPWATAVVTEVEREIGPAHDDEQVVPLASILQPLAAKRRWPELPTAKVLVGLLLAASSVKRSLALLARYDAGRRLWSHAPEGISEASAWLSGKRPEYGGVITWPDLGALLRDWCAERGTDVPSVPVRQAMALLSINEGQDLEPVVEKIGAA